MRRKFKNEIFQLLLSSEYGIDRFDFKEQPYVKDDSLPTMIIEVKNTPLYFTIRNSRDDFELFDFQFIRYAPHFPLTGFYPELDFVGSDKIIDSLKGWLDSTVKLYFEDEQEPDLWEEFKNGNRTINLNEIGFESQTNFSIDEKKQIELSINELKYLIQTNLNTTQEQQVIVNNRLDYLIEASKRLNKFDWKSLAISTLFSISIALSLDTEKGHMLFELFKKVFSIVKMLM